ncbi:hypothetical protein QI052_07055 [Staphylococcus saprophyticus]|nr:hypothetical protein [Staphylococcus saprophyticus]
MKEIETMTLTEFNYRMYAREYEMLKEEYDIYRLAFAIRDAKAEQKKKGGKKGENEFKYNSADDIINYQDNLDRLNRGESVQMGDTASQEDDKPSLDVLKQITAHNNSK